MAKQVAFEWETATPEKVFTDGMQRYLGQIETMLHQVAQQFAPQIEAWLKQNAPWSDRTGNARQSLYAEVEELVMGARIALDYGVEYGVFLELSNQSEFSVIAPALDYWGAQIWAEVRRRMSA